MASSLTRRRFLEAVGTLGLAACAPRLQHKESGPPRLARIRIATIAASDLAGVETFYTKWLDYSVTKRGSVTQALAASWGAPASAGRPYLMMQPASGVDVYIRAVGIDPMPGYRPLTTFGWNAVELIVDDVYKLHERLEASPFEIIGEPHSLGGQFASIHAMQMAGPGSEIVYLTCETGERRESTLPIPQSFVDRPFIMVLAGPDIEALEEFYGSRFGLPKIPQFRMPLPRIARAQGLPDDHRFALGLLRCAERGNSIELDQYSERAGPRPRARGELPPGVAMTSFSVASLDGLDVRFLAQPARLYGSRRAATFLGPAGELTELIEEARS
jgi:hypothetical protein